MIEKEVNGIDEAFPRKVDSPSAQFPRPLCLDPYTGQERIRGEHPTA